ncbi:MAG: universal stress protein [Haloplanus sp.]
MYDTILVPTDGSEAATTAARYALTLADAFDADVHVLSVVDPDRYVTDVVGDVDDLVRRQRAALERRAQAAVDRATEGDAVVAGAVETHVVEGRPATVLADAIDAYDADLVAMGVHGRSRVDRHLLGSLTERTVRTASVPVLTVGADDPADDGVSDVVIATDGSDGSERAADHAITVARATGARLHALTVGEVGGGADDVPARRVAERATDAGVEATAAVRDGRPHEAIVSYADDVDADLVAVGTHGRTGVRRILLGSVAERVLRTAPVPVLVVGRGPSD